jgi:hypothetical protein
MFQKSVSFKWVHTKMLLSVSFLVSPYKSVSSFHFWWHKFDSIIGLIKESNNLQDNSTGTCKNSDKYFFKEKNASSPFIESSWADLLNIPLLSIMFPRKSSYTF